jgi:hypothetical protein
MKTIIHVNQHVIKANAKTGKNDPVLTVKTYKSNTYAHEVDILGRPRWSTVLISRCLRR